MRDNTLYNSQNVGVYSLQLNHLVFSLPIVISHFLLYSYSLLWNFVVLMEANSDNGTGKFSPETK